MKQYLTEKQNGYLQSGRLREVVAYEKWSLRESWLYQIHLENFNIAIVCETV